MSRAALVALGTLAATPSVACGGAAEDEETSGDGDSGDGDMNGGDGDNNGGPVYGIPATGGFANSGGTGGADGSGGDEMGGMGGEESSGGTGGSEETGAGGDQFIPVYGLAPVPRD